MPAKIKRSPQTKRADRHMILAEKFAILRAALLSAEPSGKAAKWNDHVISALRRKRAELTGHIPEAERRLNSLREAVASIDIRFAYSIRIPTPKISSHGVPVSGAATSPTESYTRLLADTLRIAPAQLSAHAMWSPLRSRRGWKASRRTCEAHFSPA